MTRIQRILSNTAVRWIFVLLIIIAICAAAHFLLNRFFGGGHRAGVFQNGELLYIIETAEPRDYTVTDGEAYNTISTDADGAVRMTRASCRDQYCVLHGKLRSGAPIVCLPNRVVVRWLNASGGADAVTGRAA